MTSMTSKRINFWEEVFPYIFIIVLLVGGYIVAFKFIQLGLPDLGTRVLNIPVKTVNLDIGLMAIVTCISAIISGILIDKLSLGLKKRIVFLIIIGIVQAGIMLFKNFIQNQTEFMIWMIIFGFILGLLFPITYSLIFFMIPTKHRGYVAGIITGFAYLIGVLSPFKWTIEGLTTEAMIVMSPAIILMLILIFKKGLIDSLEKKTEKKIEDTTEDGNKSGNKSGNTSENKSGTKQESNYNGRFINHNFLIIVLLMFGVFFVDSFGFLRVIQEQSIVSVTWNGPFNVRIILGLTHFIAALIMGYIYQKYNEKIVFIIAFISLIIGDFLFSAYPTGTFLIITSSIYCAAVSFYTINSFAVWADTSTKKNAAIRAGIGVGIGGWLSSFLSTSITSNLSTTLVGVSGFTMQLRISGIIAIGFLIIALLFMFIKKKS